MKNLDKAIQSRQWQLNEKRLKVADLERLAARFRAEIEQLERALKQEQKVATRNTEAATGYSNYVLAVGARRDKLRLSLSEVESEMVQAVEDVATAHQEFEKLDLIRSRNREKAEMRNERSQQKAVNEAGMNFYPRMTTR